MGPTVILPATLALLLAGCGGGAPPPVATYTLRAPAALTANQPGYRASITPQAGTRYTWTVAGGTLTSGNGTPAITFTAGDAGSLDLRCTAHRPGITWEETRTLPVRVGPLIQAPAVLVLGQGTHTLSTEPQAGRSIQWRLDPGWAVQGAGTPTLQIQEFGPRTEDAQVTLTTTGANGEAPARTTLSIPVARVEDLPPAGLSYGTEDAAFLAGRPITALRPTSTGGSIATFTVDPPLPPGLVLDPGSGILHGMPTAGSDAQPYTLTATNGAGEATVTLTLGVLPRLQSVMPGISRVDVIPNATLPPNGLVQGGCIPLTGDRVLLIPNGEFNPYVLEAATGPASTLRTWTIAQPGTYGSAYDLGGGRVGLQTADALQLFDSPAVDVAGAAMVAVGQFPNAGVFPPGAVATPLAGGRYTLFCGGTADSAGLGSEMPSTAATLYDRETNAFIRLKAGLQVPRAGHSATLLANGSVLIAGGLTTDRTATPILELFTPDPQNPANGTFTVQQAKLTPPRYAHTASLLGDFVVLAGGIEPAQPGTDTDWRISARLSLLDSRTFDLTSEGSLQMPRVGHAAAVLGSSTDAQLFISGGYAGLQTTPTPSTELMKVNGVSTVGGPAMQLGRAFHPCAPLAGGGALLAGGTPFLMLTLDDLEFTQDTPTLDSLERFTPAP